MSSMTSKRQKLNSGELSRYVTRSQAREVCIRPRGEKESSFEYASRWSDELARLQMRRRTAKGAHRSLDREVSRLLQELNHDVAVEKDCCQEERRTLDAYEYLSCRIKPLTRHEMYTEFQDVLAFSRLLYAPTEQRITETYSLSRAVETPSFSKETCSVVRMLHGTQRHHCSSIIKHGLRMNNGGIWVSNDIHTAIQYCQRHDHSPQGGHLSAETCDFIFVVDVDISGLAELPQKQFCSPAQLLSPVIIDVGALATYSFDRLILRIQDPRRIHLKYLIKVPREQAVLQ